MNNKEYYDAQMQRALKALKEARQKLERFELSVSEPIAVIGMGCRYPGRCNNPADYWRFLSQGGDAIKEIPSDRWDVDFYHDDNADVPGKMYTRHGGFLERIDEFDADFFGIAPREAQSMDPQQRLLLEVSWEALEDAGIAMDRLNGSNTAVYAGVCTDDYSRFHMNGCDPAVIDAYSFTGTATSIAVGRLSYLLGLQGPNICVNTACSSSLVAVDLACRALRSRQTDLALAGGVNLIISPENNIYFCKVKALSRVGRCQTFDDDADGYVRAEGCGVVVLKRLTDALTSRDRIYALLRGSAVNQDGRSNGMTAPNGIAQQAVIRSALSNAKVKPSQIGYVEAHGTGTSLGDPIEIQALGAVLGENRPAGKPFLVGSAKTNLGHLEAAAGMAGLMKAALALQHEAIPPHPHLNKQNRHIPWDTIPVSIPSELTTWKRTDIARFAGVSGFGFSGTNAHIVLEESPKLVEETGGVERDFHVLTVSGKTEQALTDLADRFEGYLKGTRESLGDISFTANTGRKHFTNRIAVVGRTVGEIREGLGKAKEGEASLGCSRGLAGGEAPRIGFMYTGQGSQYFGMGAKLYERQPVFREAIECCDEILKPLLDRSLISLLYSSDAGLLDETVYTQPLLFSIEYALTELLKSWGIMPEIVIGHSVGEYVAACVSGVFSLDEGLRLVAERGRLMQSLPREGAMAAIFSDEQHVTKVIKSFCGAVSIAGFNAADEIVISGQREKVREAIESFRAEGISSRLLNVSHAFHSSMMRPMIEEFRRVAEQVNYQLPNIALISNLTGRIVEGAQVSKAAYWCDHVLAPVRFSDGLGQLKELGLDLFLEVGPHPILTGLGKKTDGQNTSRWLTTLRKARDDEESLFLTVAALYCFGANIDWTAFDRPYNRHRVGLPTYPFQRKRYWLEQPNVLPAHSLERIPRDSKIHPLLGCRFHLAEMTQIVFGGEFISSSNKYIDDHKVCGHTIVPATAYVDMALSAASSLDIDAPVLRDMQYHNGLIVNEHAKKTLQTIFRKQDNGEYLFKILSHNRNEGGEVPAWIEHASGRMCHENNNSDINNADIEHLKAKCPIEVNVNEFYDRLQGRGYGFGRLHRGIRQLWRSAKDVFAQITLDSILEGEADKYFIHPALLDACCQPLLELLPELNDARDTIYITVGKERVRFYSRTPHTIWCHATLASDVKTKTQEAPAWFSGTLRLYDDSGRLLGEIDNYRMVRTSRAAIEAQATDQNQQRTKLTSKIKWSVAAPIRQVFNPLGDESAPWLIFVDEDGVGNALVEKFSRDGVQFATVRRADIYRQISNKSYQINPLKREHIQRLSKDIQAHGMLPLAGVVYLWGIDGSLIVTDTLEKIFYTQRPAYEGALSLLATHNELRFKNLIFLTRGAHVVGDDIDNNPVQAWVCGLRGVIEEEYPNVVCGHIDLEKSEDDYPDLSSVVAGIAAGNISAQLAIRHGQIFARGIYTDIVLSENKSRHKTTGTQEHYQLEIGAPGNVESLQLVRKEPAAPQPDQMQIKICVSGLSFGDVLTVQGVLPQGAGQLGYECSGIVVAVGRDVTEFKIGDEVIAFSKGSLATYINIKPQYVVIKPNGMTFSQAAAIPSSFLTAHYALRHVVNLKRGDKILIHAAAGGVGMAALQIAKNVGAQIYATASKSKWSALRNMEVTQVMDSRSEGFGAQLQKLTAGSGVDVVLHSLSKRFEKDGLEALRDDGCLINIGEGSIGEEKKVESRQRGKAICSFHLETMARREPERFKSLFKEVMEKFDTGDYQPLPITFFERRDITKAFRFMRTARHIGKISISMAQRSEDEVPTRLSGEGVRAEGSYLITGGAGGVGLEVANWLVREGAKCLILVSRNATHAELREDIEVLRSKGARIELINADISSFAQTKLMFANVLETFPPLRAIFHLAGVTDDSLINNQSWDKYVGVALPKVGGAWNLFQCTRHLSLDAFVLFSSTTALVGMAGVANYACANACLDSLAYYFRTHGSPAISVNWGPWGGSGMLDQLSVQARKRWERRGFLPISPSAATDVLADLLSVLPVQRIVTAMAEGFQLENLQRTSARKDWNDRLDVLPSNNPPPSVNSPLKEILIGLPENRCLDRVIEYIESSVKKVLRLDDDKQIDPHVLLADLGMDSLMSAELRTALEKIVCDSLAASLIFDYPTIDSLAKYIFSDYVKVRQLPDDGVAKSADEQDESDRHRENEEGEEDMSVEQMRILLTSQLAELEKAEIHDNDA